MLSIIRNFSNVASASLTVCSGLLKITESREEEEKEEEYMNIYSDEYILSGPADETPDPVPDSGRIRIDYQE